MRCFRKNRCVYKQHSQTPADGLHISFKILHHSQDHRPPVGFLWRVSWLSFGRRGAARLEGWQGGWICIVSQGPKASQIQAPGINPLLGYNPIQSGVAPRLVEQRTGRSEGSGVTWGRADSDTFTRLGKPKTKRPLSSLSPMYTPPPKHPPNNKYHTAPSMPRVFAYAGSSWLRLVRRMLRSSIINTPLFLWRSHPNIALKTSSRLYFGSDRQMVASLTTFSQWGNTQPLWHLLGKSAIAFDK